VAPTTVRDAARGTPLHLLPGTEQTVVALRAEGKTYAEIGEALGVSRQRAWQLGQPGALPLAFLAEAHARLMASPTANVPQPTATATPVDPAKVLGPPVARLAM
jgi:hypothetical protein